MGCHKSKPANNDSPGAGASYRDPGGSPAAVTIKDQPPPAQQPADPSTLNKFNEQHNFFNLNNGNDEQLVKKIGELEGLLRNEKDLRLRETNELKNTNAELVNQKNTLSVDLKVAQEQISKLTEDFNRKLEVEKQNHLQQVQFWKNQAEGIQDGNFKVQEDIVNIKHRANSLELQKLGLETENARMKQELSLKSQEIANLQSNLRNIQITNSNATSNLQSERDSLLRSVFRLQQETLNLQAENAHQSSQFSVLRNQYQTLETQNTALYNQLANLERQTANSRLPQQPNGQLSSTLPTLQQDNQKLQQENRQLRASFGKLESEIESLKTDIENFKSWTKKLDWSTANIPDALTKHYEIKQVDDVKGTFSDGTPFTRSGQTVDNVWHGPYVTVKDTDQTVYRGNKVNGQTHGERNITVKGECPGEQKDMWWMGKNLNKIIKLNTDGGVLYKCADEENKGVSVTVLTHKGQHSGCYPVKNGYKVWLHTYNDEINVEKRENDQMVSDKWYQLKK